MSRALTLGATDRVLVLAPHPDDDVLAASGLLQHAVACNAAVRVLYATDGENNPWAQRAIEHRWRVGPSDHSRWGARRRREALDALALLGVPPNHATFLGLRDQGLTDILLRRDSAALAVAMLADHIEAFRPTVVAGPSLLDLHPDHSALGVLVRLALRGPVHRSRGTLGLDYLIHVRRPPLCLRHATWHCDLTSEQRARKRAAILAHASQLAWRKHMLLTFATQREGFLEHAPQEDHPVQKAMVDGQTLRLQLQRRPRPGAFGESTLHLVLDDRARGRLRGILPFRSSRFALCDIASGASIAWASWRGNSRTGEVVLPLATLRTARSLFVKLERRFGFFDEGGWREIVLSVDDRPRHARSLGGPRASVAAPALDGEGWRSPSDSAIALTG